MTCIEKIQSAAQEESAVSNLDGWLFTDFGGRDKLTAELLCMDGKKSTRRWVYLVRKDGLCPVKILHAIEPGILSRLPGGETYTYSSRQELANLLEKFSGQKFAVLSDSEIPIISTVDGGFIDTLRRAGIRTVSAAPLVQRAKGLLSPAGINSHERASSLLYKTAASAWDFIRSRHEAGAPVTESDVASFIMKKYLDYGLCSDSAPLVAFGRNTANPHYEVPPSGGAVANPGDVIQLDIWAKERIAPDDNGNGSAGAAVYADISVAGIYAESPTAEQEAVFRAVCRARDAAVSLLREAFEEKSPVTGAQVDAEVRSIIEGAGYADCIRHRTGHGIDTSCHGSGANLDSTEFPDNRRLLPGSCFSVEPGIYTAEFGMRTEIDIYIKEDGCPVISGRKFNAVHGGNAARFPQQKLLTTKDGFDEDHN